MTRILSKARAAEAGVTPAPPATQAAGASDGDDRSPPALARRIRAMIQSGEARPGTHLGTVELAARFQVSRGPLRESLRLLESAGLVRIIPQRGAFVVALDDAEVQDMLRLREVLFALLAQRCAEDATPPCVLALARELAELEDVARSASGTAREFQIAAYRYVAQMNAIVDSPRLALSIRDLSIGAAEAYGHLAVATREMRLADLRGYQKLHRAIAAGDAAAAFQQARAMHAQGVKRAIDLSASLPTAAPGVRGEYGLRRRRKPSRAG